MKVLKSHKNFMFNRGRGKPYKDEIKTYSAFSRDPDPYAELRLWPTLSNATLAEQIHVPATNPTAVEDEFWAYRWYKIRTPAQGVGIHERIGSSIFLKSIYLKGYFEIKPRLQRPTKVKLMMMECKNRFSDVSFNIGSLTEFENLPTLPTQIPDGFTGASRINEYCAKTYYLSTLASSQTDTCRVKKVWEAVLYPQAFKAASTNGSSYGVTQPVEGSINTQAVMLGTTSLIYHKFSTVIKINRHYNMEDYGLYFMWMIDGCCNINEEHWDTNVQVPGPSTADAYENGPTSFLTGRADKLGFNLRFYSKAYFTDS